MRGTLWSSKLCRPICLGRGGLVARYGLQGRGVPGSKSDFTKDASSGGLMHAKSDVVSKLPPACEPFPDPNPGFATVNHEGYFGSECGQMMGTTSEPASHSSSLHATPTKGR
ncbi:hypothetical protein AVEN_175797-1, partial [Araneus ventricosus]